MEIFNLTYKFVQQVDSSDKGIGMWPYCGLRPAVHSFVSPEFTENDRMPKYSFVRDSSQIKFQKIDQDWVSIQTILMKDGTKPVSRNVDVDEVCTSEDDKSVINTHISYSSRNLYEIPVVKTVSFHHENH